MSAAQLLEGDGDKKVMVAIDESEYSYYALMWALDNLGESLTKCHVIIFMAQPPPQYVNTFAASLGNARLYCPVVASNFTCLSACSTPSMIYFASWYQSNKYMVMFVGHRH